MKKLSLLLLLIMSLLTCSDDDVIPEDNTPVKSNEITLDGMTIEVADALAAEYGIIDFGGGGIDSSHYHYEFLLTDGVIKINSLDAEDYRVETENSNIIILNKTVRNN